MNKNNIPRATPEDIERLEREAKKPKRQRKRPYPELRDFDKEDRKEIKSSLGYSRVGMWGRH
jgi:hypothetical protein